MGKAQRYKEQRREERQHQELREARKAHWTRWAAFIISFVLLATVILPKLYSAYGNDFLRKAPFNWGVEQEPVQTNPVVVIATDKGTITVELNRKEAPKTVARISELVGQGFYNGLTFHRVEPGFVVQGGDPTGNGTGGSGKNIPFEANELKHEKGVIAMARSQAKDSADSQFYITLDALPMLDGEYVVFGKVLAGMEVVEQIAKGDKMNSVTLQAAGQ